MKVFQTRKLFLSLKPLHGFLNQITDGFKKVSGKLSQMIIFGDLLNKTSIKYMFALKWSHLPVTRLTE